MTNRLYFSVYLPKNLKLEEVIQKHAPEEIKHLKYYKYFITKVIDERIKNAQYSLNDYVRLKSSYLNNIMTSNHTKRIISNLINWNIIEEDKQYIVGTSSKGYRLSQRYRTEAFDVSKIKDHKMSAKIYHFAVTENMNKINSTTINVNKYYNMLPYDFKSLNPFQKLINNLDAIEIDAKAAMEYINSVKFVKDRSIYTAFVQRFENKEHFFSISDKVGRVFTTISNCPKALIPFLSVEGKKLKEIDIANSQPLFLNSLIDEYLNDNNLQSTPDIELYKRKTSQGRFYTFLQTQCPSTPNIDELKELFFKVILFGKNSTNYETQDSDIYTSRLFQIKVNELIAGFERFFPEVFKIIRYYKRKNHADLAIKLQQLESGIIIPLALVISNKYHIYTKHDSLIVTEDLAESAQHHLQEELKFYKLKAKVRIK